ncbi:peptidoglycan DD-metalloendopeptidase family protein [Clavibacter michiganensis subsp. michiganensis]|uniref:peptidoglycan DD-metalloendopeptidase family protein n=1 Tax=Clavibacter michiganensis TaxID=28447 RepID=UPI001868D506|nr:peptidoglycan DD-metalloendopeptidase family protein [Clavibacter michiganensis]MBE3079598.1 peptidoglycan DD-metalloendopeptidase family protein [Clavibacter michiganensis subsp. michiganensis]
MHHDLLRSSRASGARRSRPRGRRSLQAIVAIAAVLLTGSIAAPAHADTFASWDDVQKARGDEQAQQALVQRINDEIASLQQKVADAQALVVQRGDEHDKAQQDADDKHAETVLLQEKVDAADAKATKSQEQAAGLAKQLMRSGGQNLSGTLLLSEGDGTDDLLDKLGTMSKVAEKSDQIYAIALQDRNAAKSLSDQAQVALTELDALNAKAEQLLEEAAQAQLDLEQALEDQSAQKADADAKLSVITENREATEDDYQAGVRKRQADANALAASQGSAGGDVSPGAISSSGWTAPLPGASTSSPFGYRIHPIYHTKIMHAGEDLVRGYSCGEIQYAAHSGTVSFAGRNGGYGNYIRIDHGGGVSSAYGHIVDGGTLVRTGQQVVAGQPIARTGTTGGSTGCHLHFEIRIDGNAVDPVAFMHGQGVSITSTH